MFDQGAINIHWHVKVANGIMQTGLLVAHCSYLEATVVNLAVLFDKKFETVMGFIEILIILRAMVMRKIQFSCHLHIYSVCKWSKKFCKLLFSYSFTKKDWKSKI